MPVLHKWDNDAKNVYLFIMRGDWNWGQYQKALSEGYTAIQEVEHKVDLIYAYISDLPSGDAVQYLMLASESQPKNCYRSVIANPNGAILQIIITAVDDMRNWDGPKFFDTIDEAREYLKEGTKTD